MPTKTPDLTKLSADDLTAEVARREAEAATEQAARAELLEQARHAWATDTWAKRDQTDADLMQQGQDAREAFSAAVRSADLPGAFKAWIAERSARYAREGARNKAMQAGSALGEDITRIPNLRWYDPDFLSRLEAEADKLAREHGYALADELVTEAPTEVE
jgi:hypothetical protein